MDLRDNWKNLKERARSLKLSQLRGFRQIILVILVADIFGVYYWLKMRNLGIIILFLSLICMGVVLYLERDAEDDTKEDKMTKKKKKQRKEDKKDLMGDFKVDLGVGDANDYNKRLKKALN